MKSAAIFTTALSEIAEKGEANGSNLSGQRAIVASVGRHKDLARIEQLLGQTEIDKPRLDEQQPCARISTSLGGRRAVGAFPGRDGARPSSISIESKLKVVIGLVSANPKPEIFALPLAGDGEVTPADFYGINSALFLKTQGGMFRVGLEKGEMFSG